MLGNELAVNRQPAKPLKKLFRFRSERFRDLRDNDRT
jgi:hypothetical protein